MSKKLLITLTPADYYFFGGENTFDTDTLPGVRNYLVRSNRLPQQTALVGLLRHVLFENGLSYGAESFKPDYVDPNTGKPDVQKFGTLHNISPLFIQSGDGANRRFFLPAPWVFLSEKQEISIEFEGSTGKRFSGTDFLSSPKLEFYNMEKLKKESYTAKEYLGDFWVALDNGEKIPSEFKQNKGGIFISSLHIGIDKMSRMGKNSINNSSADEEGFYKQEFFRLSPGYKFAVIAEVDDTVPIKIFQKITMPFGGESRTFCLDAEGWEGDLAIKWDLSKVNPKKDCIVLLSDAFVEEPDVLFGLCRFVIAECKPFRNIQIKTSDYSDKTLFANLHRKKRQELTYLLERGSVFFPIPGQEKNVISLLNEHKNFKNIGYNYFQSNQTTV